MFNSEAIKKIMESFNNMNTSLQTLEKDYTYFFEKSEILYPQNEEVNSTS